MSVPVSSNPIENAIENLRDAFNAREKVHHNARAATTKVLLFRVESLLNVYDATAYAIALGETVDINRVLYDK